MRRLKVTALGDSITKGVVLTNMDRYAVAQKSFMDIAGEKLGMDVINCGKFGSTVTMGEKIVSRYSKDISESQYTFIEYGGNDCDFDWSKIAETPSGEYSPKTKLEDFRNRFIGLINRVRELGSIPVILSLPPILSEKYYTYFSSRMSEEQKENVIRWLGGDVGINSRWHETYNRTLFLIAAQTRTGIIDVTSPFDTYRGDLKTLFCTDGIHPNENGYRLIADTIINQLSLVADN